jgi:secretion/DNA translocation related TadE-like protein
MATVWTAITVVALFFAGTFVFWLGAAGVARHRAEGAADLTALAAAGEIQRGSGAACDGARWVADRMAAWLISCRVERMDALIEVSAALPGYSCASARPVGALERRRCAGRRRAAAHRDPFGKANGQALHGQRSLTRAER